MPFGRVWTTYSWHTRPVRNAIDGNKDTAWLAWGPLEIPHSAIFYLPEPLPASDVEQLTIRLVNGGEAEIAPLGRFRLSIQRGLTPDDTAAESAQQERQN
jgi:hypothetical protein